MTNIDATKAVERALAELPKDKSFAPKKTQGINEMLEEAETNANEQLMLIREIKKRMAEFDRLSNTFLNGIR